MNLGYHEDCIRFASTMVTSVRYFSTCCKYRQLKKILSPVVKRMELLLQLFINWRLNSSIGLINAPLRFPSRKAQVAESSCPLYKYAWARAPQIELNFAYGSSTKISPWYLGCSLMTASNCSLASMVSCFFIRYIRPPWS